MSLRFGARGGKADCGEHLQTGWRMARRRCLSAQHLQPLIDGKSKYPKHEMRHDLDGAAIANVARSEFIFQPCVDTFHRSALSKAHVFSGLSSLWMGTGVRIVLVR